LRALPAKSLSSKYPLASIGSISRVKQNPHLSGSANFNTSASFVLLIPVVIKTSFSMLDLFPTSIISLKLTMYHDIRFFKPKSKPIIKKKKKKTVQKI
jgi:hypothetical protein